MTNRSTATTSTIQSEPDARLHVEVWGEGTPVVLVHGSLATGADEWSAQQALGEDGFQLLVPDRRGYGRSPVASGEDYLVDAADIAGLMGDGAHLVGHSYGGLGAMHAAADNPGMTLSLTLLEPAATSVVAGHPAIRELDDAVRALWATDLADAEWAEQFLAVVGSDPSELPPELLAAAVEMVPVFRGGRPYFDASPPIGELAAADYPKLVVSGGHSAGFDALCIELADRIGADHAVITGAGHEIQFVGQPLNDRLAGLWRQTRSS